MPTGVPLARWWPRARLDAGWAAAVSGLFLAGLLGACGASSGSSNPAAGGPAPSRTSPTSLPGLAGPPSATPTGLPAPPASAGTGTGAHGAPTVTPTALPGTDPLEAAAQDSLEQGLIAYNPPQEVTQDEEFEVVVRLQRGTVSTSSALVSVPGPGPVTFATIPVGAYMSAALDGPGFSTRLIGSNRVPLAVDETAQFSWVVTPKAPGPHTLTLTLTAEVQGQPARQRIYERRVNVNVVPQPNFPTRVLTWSGWSEAFSGALAAGLVAGVTWLVTRMRRHQRIVEPARKPHPPATDPGTTAQPPGAPAEGGSGSPAPVNPGKTSPPPP